MPYIFIYFCIFVSEVAHNNNVTINNKVTIKTKEYENKIQEQV